MLGEKNSLFLSREVMTKEI
uniref:Uncharacterized protein n=1 Tax=Arundo donax TaxID=35708 RepID=A0A0A8Z9T6_ARUDO